MGFFPGIKTEGEVILFMDEKDKPIGNEFVTKYKFPETIKFVYFQNLQEKLLELKDDIWRILKQYNSRVYHAAAKDDKQVEQAFSEIAAENDHNWKEMEAQFIDQGRYHV